MSLTSPFESDEKDRSNSCCWQAENEMGASTSSLKAKTMIGIMTMRHEGMPVTELQPVRDESEGEDKG